MKKIDKVFGNLTDVEREELIKADIPIGDDVGYEEITEEQEKK